VGAVRAAPAGPAPAAGLAALAVQESFRGYLEALAQRGAGRIAVPDLPDEPVLLSYLVAASIIVELADKQALLAEPDAARRLSAERALLARETTILRRLPSTPAADLRNSPYSPN
jgi:hypothetical protein